tara:strand:- start:448 stop:858 length:411 start_codon:yes stop_codon:yes gene_type:complete
MELTAKTLHSISNEVPFGTNLNVEICKMFSLMDAKRGVGLAANQVGMTARVIVVDVKGFRSAIINPVITRKSGKKKVSVEGCLSFPSKNVKVMRDEAVTVSGFDHLWNPVKKNCRGLLAFCIQHEIDHLDGVTIVK